jgi:hypothetical protein
MVPMKFRKWLAAGVVGASLVAATACGGSADPASHDHGRVVAHLPIQPPPHRVVGEHGIIHLTVPVGQRFSVKVDTSDGPFFWDEAGSPPDPRLARFVGDFNDGYCGADQYGCRVPYFHTLLARSRGTTTMTWRFHNVSCPPGRDRASKATARCTRIETVVFDITIR